MPNHALRPPRLADARELLDSPPGMRATIHVAGPDEPGFPQLEGVAHRYRLAVEVARKRLRDGEGELADDARATDEELRASIDPVAIDAASLPHHAWSLACFFGPGFRREYALPIRGRDDVHVGRRFALLPLLRAAREDRSFRVLALAANRVRLLEGDAEELRVLEPDGVPSDMVEALGARVEREPDLQFHSTARGGEAAVFHGHGGAPDERSIDFERFRRAIARAVERAWGDRRDPLVLAADRAHQGRFRKTAELPGLLPRGLEGSPERLSIGELHARARALVRELAGDANGELAQELDRLRGAGRLVERLEDARASAEEGRVQRLWLADDADRRGELEELVELVLRQGGEPVVLDPEELPLDSGVAAELRGAGARPA